MERGHKVQRRLLLYISCDLFVTDLRLTFCDSLKMDRGHKVQRRLLLYISYDPFVTLL